MERRGGGEPEREVTQPSARNPVQSSVGAAQDYGLRVASPLSQAPLRPASPSSPSSLHFSPIIGGVIAQLSQDLVGVNWHSLQDSVVRSMSHNHLEVIRSNLGTVHLLPALAGQ
jgi:hypothetical protein